MPITKSAKKSLRQNTKEKKRNKVYRDKVKSLIKEFRSFVDNKKNKEAEVLLPKIYKALDKAAKSGVIKENTASRKKSRLSKVVKKIKS